MKVFGKPRVEALNINHMRLIFGKIAKKFIFLCFVIFLFVLFFHQGIETEDVWLHLSIGRWIINHVRIPHEDIFPFANEKTLELCHEWMASTFLYLVYKIGGFLGLKLFRSLILMLTAGIFICYSYRRLPFSFLALLIVVISYGLFQRPLLRPDTFNLIFVQLFLMCLLSYERMPDRRKLFLLPPISVLWINIHMMGAFIYGGAIIFIFLMSALIKYFTHKYKNYSSDILIKYKNQSKDLALILLIFEATFIMNPYGIEGALFPYKVIIFPQYFGLYKMFQVVGEYQSSTYIFSSLNYFYFQLLIICPVLLLLINRKNNYTLIPLFILALIFFLKMNRNSAFFTIIASYSIVEGVQNTGFTKMWSKVRWSALIDGVMLTGITFFLVIQTVRLLNESVYFNGKSHKSLFLEADPNVLSSLNLLKDNLIQGPVFNDTLLGGAIIWNAYPQLRPFDDGRYLDYQRFNDAINILLGPWKFWHQAERIYGFKILILNASDNSERRFIKYLGTQNDWQLIAVNGPYVIYVKRKAFRLPERLNIFEQQLKSEIMTENDASQLRGMIHRKPRPIIERFFNPSPSTVDLFFTGVTLMNLGYKGSAAKDFIKALKISDQSYTQKIVNTLLKQFAQSIAYCNRGFLFAKKGYYAKALSDFNKAIEINPENTQAYVNRGTYYAQQGNLSQALLDYSKVIELNPGFKEAYFNRSVTYYQLREYNRAWEDVYKAEQLGYAVNPRFLEDLKNVSAVR